MTERDNKEWFRPSMRNPSDLTELQRDASMGRLAAAIVHESRNIIGGILAFSQMGKTHVANPEKSAELFDLIEQESRRCMEIFNNAVDTIRGSKSSMLLEKVRCDITQCVRSVEMLTRHQLEMSQVALEIVLKEELGEAPITGSGLSQVLINLILNARSAIGTHGVVRLTAERTDERIVIRVSDTGPGVSAMAREHIFDAFFTTKGTAGGGLGLSISRKIVEMSDGTLTLEDSEEGACFRN